MRSRLRFTFLTVFAVVAMVWAPLVSAQSGSYTSDLSGSEISWNDSWTGSQSDFGEGVLSDGVQLNNSDSGSDVFVGYVTAGQDPVEVRDAFITATEREVASISVLEQGTYNNVTYRVDLLREDGEDPEGVYTLQIANDATGSAVAYVLIADVASFSDGVGTVQSGITIDGGPAMNGVDPAGMQSFLELAQSTSSQSGTTDNLELPTDPVSDTPDDTTTTTGGTYTNPTWGYTVEYDSAFMDVSDGDTDLMLGSQSPLLVVVFLGIENPGVATSILYDALLPTFIDTLGAGGTFVDGGYSDNSVVWAGITGEGLQMMQQVVLVSPTTAVLITIVGEPGVPMNTVGEIRLNGVSIFGN